jgi:hypothetical protein
MLSLSLKWLMDLFLRLIKPLKSQLAAAAAS